MPLVPRGPELLFRIAPPTGFDPRAHYDPDDVRLHALAPLWVQTSVCSDIDLRADTQRCETNRVGSTTKPRKCSQALRSSRTESGSFTSSCRSGTEQSTMGQEICRDGIVQKDTSDRSEGWWAHTAKATPRTGNRS